MTINNPHFKQSQRFADLHQEYDLVDTLYGGTAAMIQAGELYLPKEPMEGAENYRNRLNNSTLLPKYKRTIKKGVGKAFAKGINIEVPEPLQRLVDNVDGSGTSLETFAKNLLDSAINYGITYLLVDFPETGEIKTLADERASGAYPYFVEIKPTQLLDLKVAYIASRVALTYFRFLEQQFEYAVDGVTQMFVEQTKEFIRHDSGVIEYNIYRKDKDGREYLYYNTILKGFTVIPVVPVYGNKIAPFYGSPTLIDLAYMNVKHWRKQSDLDHNEHYGLVPILGLKGFQETVDANGNVDKFVLSANTAVKLPEGGAIEWTKADADGIKAARESIKHLEAQMDEAGLELTAAQQLGPETATGRIIDAAEANSILKAISVDLEWSLYEAILIAGSYIGVDATQTTVDLDTTYTVSAMGDFTGMIQLYKIGVLDKEDIINEAKARNLFQSEDVVNRDRTKLFAVVDKPEDTKEIE